jgi:hypothetical protein
LAVSAAFWALVFLVGGLKQSVGWGVMNRAGTYLGFFTLVFFTGFAVPPSFPASLSLSSAVAFFAFFAFFAFGLLAVSSAFDGPRFRTFEVGGGEAAGFLTTAAGFLRGGMVWKCGVGTGACEVEVEVSWARNFTRGRFVR